VICIERVIQQKKCLLCAKFHENFHIAKAKVRLTLSTQLYACELGLWEGLARKTFLNLKPYFILFLFLKMLPNSLVGPLLIS
jgi:hypothetical protein